MKDNKRKLTLFLFPPNEMAEIKEGDHSVLMGNYWDFHRGCYGTKLTFKDGAEIDFNDKWHHAIKGPKNVSKMIADAIGAELEIKVCEEPFF